MSPIALVAEAELDVFDLDFQELQDDVIAGNPMMVKTIDRTCVTFGNCGTTATCFQFSCTNCCAGSDYRTGC
jgi:hypothetical protein